MARSRDASQRVLTTYTHALAPFGIASSSQAPPMATLRHCAESLTPEERETLAQAVATLPMDWTVEVLKWELDTAASDRPRESEFPIPQLEVRVRAPNSIHITAVGQPRPVEAAAAFIKACGADSART